MQRHKTKIKIIIAILLLIILALFGYFYNNHIITSKPEKQYALEVENTHISNLSLAVKINVKKLNKQIDEAIPNGYPFSHRKNACIKKFGVSIDCKFKGYIKKSGDISIIITENNIQFKIPIYVKIKVSASIISKTANVYLDLFVRLNQKISPDWALSSDDVQISKVLNKCYIRVLGIKISICGMIEKPLQQQIKKFSTKLQALDLRAKVKEVWQYAHRVNQISFNPDVYLITEPKTLAFSGFNVIDNTLIANLALGAKLNIVAEHKPNNPKYTPLPQLGTNTEDNFAISLPVRVPYTTLENALKQLSSKDLQYKGNTVIINDIEVYPSASRLVVSVDFEIDAENSLFNSKGLVYFYGKPVIDIKNKVIRIEDFKLTSNTDNNLVSVLGFITSIFSQPIYNFENDYKNLVSAIHKNPFTFNKIQLNIKLDEKSIRVQDLHLLKNDIDIGVIIEGKAEFIF